MSDPLSVATGIVGLITAGAKITMTLYNIGSGIQDAPKLTQAAADELTNITVVLQQLQAYVLGKARASVQRLNLITVEHITATLTSCVVTYSELDVVLKSLHADTGLRAWDRGMWYLKRDKVAEIVQRMQNHKATLALMLNILQCATLSEAESSMDRLCDTVNEVLRSNRELTLRLRNMEQLHVRQQTDGNEQTGSMIEAQADTGAADDDALATDRDSERHSLSPSVSQSEGTVEQDRLSGDHTRTSHFEELLHRSRVYRHVDMDDDTPSLISDARSTLALSICSSLTLGEVSNISVYAIPIYAHELSNASCYQFDAQETPATRKDSREATPTKLAATPTKPAATPTKSAATPERRQWRALFKRSPRQQTFNAISTVPQAVFGVWLTQSIRYANVAISLYDDSGRSYIYGYLPIIVGKCGVYLKEKGASQCPKESSSTV